MPPDGMPLYPNLLPFSNTIAATKQLSTGVKSRVRSAPVVPRGQNIVNAYQESPVPPPPKLAHVKKRGTGRSGG